MKRAAGHIAILDPDRKANQSWRRRFVLQDQGFTRSNRIEEFRGADSPALKINSARQFDGLEHLIEQYGARQHRVCGKVARKRWVVRRDM